MTSTDNHITCCTAEANAITTFNAVEHAQEGYERAKDYLIRDHFAPEVKARSESVLQDIVSKYGPVVDGYPSWHPLVNKHEQHAYPPMKPCEANGYEGLDHTIFFANAFVSCPYRGGKAEKLFKSANKMWVNNCNRYAVISGEMLNETFYAEGTQPVLVTCEWQEPLDPGNLIPKRLAVPLMIQQEMKCWEDAQYAETWENMQYFTLGSPYDDHSSLFVSQDTIESMKQTYEAMVDSGMFGPHRR